MSRKVHIESAVNAYKNFGEGRQHVVAFCVTIEHAEILRQAFIDAGISAAVIHSKMDKDAREKNMQDFEDGVCRVICNVGVLTEGWDCTCVDCILFCRPTMSPALYVQMVGRGLRTHPGKTDCLLLDLSGNCLRHGDINEPLVSVPGQTTKKQSMPSPVKECPNCGELFPRRLRECPSCGWMPEIPPLENAPEVEEMHEVKFSNGPFKAHVLNFSIKSHRSKAGNMFAKLSMSCNVPDLGSLPVWVCSYLDFEGEVSEYRKAKAWEAWSKITRGSEPPKTIDEAVRRASEIVMPDVIKIKRNGQYLNVVRWGE